MKIGLAIAMRREQLGLTQDELAFAVGVSKTTISRWESGVYLIPCFTRNNTDCADNTVSGIYPAWITIEMNVHCIAPDTILQ